MVPSSLPDGPTLAYGVATASYQIEGAVAEDGRGPSIWDTFAARPGTVRDGLDGSVACDSYHRYEEDLDLVAGMGAGWYRFSIAWPRIVPEGVGRVESRGLDYYDRLVDAALARGVSPTATLYHWDLPQPLEDRDGWLNRDTAEAFADYAAVVHDRLGDRVRVWATHNEPWCAAYLGYAAGVHAPGRREGGNGPPRRRTTSCSGTAWPPRGSTRPAPPTSGIVLNLAPFWPEDSSDADVVAATDDLDALRNRLWLGPLVDGRYDDGLLAVAPELADPAVVRGRRPRHRPRVGRLGGRELLHALPHRGAPTPTRRRTPRRTPTPAPGPCRSWSVSPAPTSAGRSTRPASRRSWSTPIGVPACPSLVTENGAAYPDDVFGPGSAGTVDDQDRIAYLRDHIAATLRAREAGADVRAYIVWTLLDNFEWAEGYTKTFGIVHVDPRDQTRTPKASFHWLAEHISNSTDPAVTP